MHEAESECGILLGNPYGKKALGRLRLWDDKMKKDLKERVWIVDELHVTQDRDQRRAVVKTGAIKCAVFLD